jgi:hypothetical protein
MLYLENYKNQNSIVVLFTFPDIETTLIELDNLMDLYLSQGVVFTYDLLIGSQECDIIFYLKDNGFKH